MDSSYAKPPESMSAFAVMEEQRAKRQR